MTNPPHPLPLSYKDAGVDIDAGDALVERIKPLAKKTMREGVLAGIGGFGALFEVPKRYKEPVLVSGTDGVGTKLKLAFEWDMHDTVGIDLVAMSVNDVLVQGAEPLFFLDYFACGKLDVDTAAAVVGGIATRLRAVGLRADWRRNRRDARHVPRRRIRPGGFCRGRGREIQDPDRRRACKPGDVVLGLASSGVHSNGFSLVRKCIERAGAAPLPATLDGKPFKQAVMEPTRLYVKNVLAALADSTPHQGAGPHHRRRPAGEHSARAARRHWRRTCTRAAGRRPSCLPGCKQTAGIDDIEMNRTFNNGIGMVVVVDAAQAEACAASPACARRAGVRIGTHRSARRRRVSARPPEAASPMTSRRHLRRIPRGIWALGFVSLLMDVSYRNDHGLLPVFMTTAGRQRVGGGAARRRGRGHGADREGVFGRTRRYLGQAQAAGACWATAWVRCPSRCLHSPAAPAGC